MTVCAGQTPISYGTKQENNDGARDKKGLEVHSFS